MSIFRTFAALALLALPLLLGAGVAAAGDWAGPAIPKARAGTTCVDDPAFMRLNHMSLLSHERDAQLRDGDRGGKYDLRQCLECHAVKDTAGSYVSADSPQHFCVACHEYAAVTPDCWSCHTSVPGGPDFTPDQKASR